MKLYLRKILSILLCAVMISTTTLPHFASSDLIPVESTEASYDELEEETTLDVEESTTLMSYEESKETELSEETEIVEEADESSKAYIEEDNNEPEEDEENINETLEPIEDEESDAEKSTLEFNDEETESTEGESESLNVETEESSLDEESKDLEESKVVEESIEESMDEIATASCADALVATESEAVVMEEIILNEIATKSQLMTFEQEEYHNYGFIRPNSDVSPAVLNRKGLFRSNNIPTSYDSREHTNASTGLNHISPIRNQSPYGSCWMFATMAIFEASARVKGLAKTDEEANLSEAAGLYFTYGLKDITKSGSAYIDEPGLEGNDYAACNSNFADLGGNMTISTLVTSSYVGTVMEDDETSYSRLSDYKNKINSYTIDGNYAFKKNKYIVKNAYYMNKNNEEIVKQAIIDYGAIGISYYAGQATAAQVGGDDKYMNKVGDDYYYYTLKSQSVANHEIAVVGWDDSVPATNFRTYDDNGNMKTPSKNGAWLCRNSWGNYSSSNGGYFWMTYDETSLNDTMYAIDVMPPDTYKYNYHYDTTGSTTNISIGDATKNNTLRAANVFKVSNTVNQTLDAVSVAIQSPNSNMTIRIYTSNSAMSKPTDGTLKHTQEVSNTTAGIFTIPLSNKVNLTKGTYYSIVVDVWSSGKEANLYLDGVNQLSDGHGNSVYFYNQADYNQSFWTRGEYGDNWQDLNATGMQQDSEGNKYGNNWRIKGLANPVEGEEIKYTVDFNLNGKGSYIEPQQIKNKQKVTKPADPVATGYTFGGWYKDSQLTKSWDFENDVVTSNITLYAKWNAVTYTITYNVNGGSVSKSSITKTYGTNVNLDTPTRSGYVFSGWYKESNLTTSYDGKSDLANTQGANITIYAKWVEEKITITYTITYNANGGSVSKQSITKTHGTNVTLDTPTRSGYKFEGWYKDSNLTTPYDGKSDLTNTQGANVTIYAKWNAVTYTITYNVNGGSISKSSITKTYGTNVNLDTPTRSGYKFEGWYKDSNLTAPYDGKSDLANTQGANVTIYAKWTAVIYTITYNANGGSVSKQSITKTHGTNVTLDTPTRSGYKFEGWYKDSNLTTPYDGKSDLTNTQGDNVTIYAKWTAVASNTSSSNKNNGGGSTGGSRGGSSGGSGGSGGSSSKGAANLNVNLPNNTSSTSEYQVGTTVDSVTGITLSVTKNATDGSIEAVSTNPITGVIQKVIVDAVTGVKNTSININFSQKPIAYTNSTSTWIATSDGKWKLSMMNQLGQISQPAEQWACVNSNTTNADGTTSTVSNFYFFDSKGEMLTGWLTDITGKTYFLETAQTNDIGKMTRGWKVINNKYYYFSGDGVLVRNGVSDDGYALDANGEWKN